MLRFLLQIIFTLALLIAVIIAALLTPSTDPITQLLLSGAILFLYFLGEGMFSEAENKKLKINRQLIMIYNTGKNHPDFFISSINLSLRNTCPKIFVIQKNYCNTFPLGRSSSALEQARN